MTLSEQSDSYLKVEPHGDGWLATVRVPSEQTTVPSDDAWVQVTAHFGTTDHRAADAWAENVRDWLLSGGSFNPDRALTLMPPRDG